MPMTNIKNPPLTIVANTFVTVSGISNHSHNGMYSMNNTAPSNIVTIPNERTFSPILSIVLVFYLFSNAFVGVGFRDLILQ